MLRGLRGLTALTGLAAASSAAASPFRLVGAYELGAVDRLAALEAPAEDEADLALRLAGLAPDLDAQAAWTWQAAPGMRASCGPAKAPDGLGVVEAEAVATGLSPALVLVLERGEGGSTTPTAADIRVALGDGEPQVLLQPAVLPRHLAVRIGGEADLRAAQLVRTQVEMELCLEHKVGRGWVGGDTTRLRQAILLDPPDASRPDRKFFGGQRDPVPALLGPPDACLQRAEGLEERDAGGAGGSSLALVPTDVWGAGLRPCTASEQPGLRPTEGGAALPLHLGGQGGLPTVRPEAAWQELAIELHAATSTSTSTGTDTDTDTGAAQAADPLAGTELSVLLDGELLVDGVALQVPGAGPGERGLFDILAHVPHRYPTLGSPEDPDRYVVLVVPQWQLAEALARLEAGSPEAPRPRASTDQPLAVAEVLSRPELLFVQARDPARPAGAEWLELTEVMGQSGPSLRGWGYTAGLLAGREPAVTAGSRPPSWEQGLSAQRAREHSAVLGAVAVVLVVGLPGLVRVRELWSRVPEERADYWPGGVQPDQELQPDSPGTKIVEEQA